MKAVDLPLFYNASAILESNLTNRADKMALYSDERELTFQDVADESNQVSHALIALGVGFGERVGILAPDSAEWVTSFFGIIKTGAVAVGLNTLLKSQDYDYIFRDSRLRVLIIHDTLVPLIDSVRHHHPTLQQVIVIGHVEHEKDISFKCWIQDQKKQPLIATTHRDDFCSLHYSSGTTGQPKGMFHAHKDYPLIAQNTGVELFGLTENDRTFAVAKLFFVYGLGGNLVMPWFVGASIVLYAGSPRMAHGVLDTMAHFKPTVLYSVPTVYISQLTLSNLAQRYDFSSLRLCISAGEALTESAWQQWKEQTGLAILDTIGCTESFHTFLANRVDDLCPGSSGKPSPGYQVKLVDDEGGAVAQGEIGNLLVKGESTVLFYLHQYEKTRQTFQGEWLLTGDKYRLDTNGFYWHAGRVDDMMKIGGLWVSPVEVENVLSQHSAVQECAVVGVSGHHEVIDPKAFICLAKNHNPSNELIRALLLHCKKQLAIYKCPRWVEFVDELPKTAKGKIQRYKLRTEGRSV